MPRHNRNRVTITDRTITGTKVPAGRQTIDVFDAVIPGLVLRVRASGRRQFWAVYRRAGKMKWVQVKDPALAVQEWPVLTLGRAREIAKELLRVVGDGRDPVAEAAAAAAARAAAQTQTLRALSDLFIETAKAQGKKKWKEPAGIFRNRLTPLLDRPVAALTKAEIRPIIEALNNRGKRVYANRVLSWTRRLLNFGIEQNWLESNPLGIIKANPEKKRKRVLGDPEIRTYWAWLETPSPAWVTRKDDPMVQWLLLAAWCRLRLVLLARSNEVLGMQWSHLDLDSKRPVWIIPDTKNGEAHLIPLPPMAVAILKRLRATQGDPVMVFAGIQSPHDRRNIFKGSGLVDLQLKDARRTAATNLGKLGVDEFFISRVLNHSRSGKSNVTAVYNQWQYEPQKREALTKWATTLQRIVKPLRLVKRGAA